jgi:hypothetical protein
MSYDFDYDGLDPQPLHTRPAELEPEPRLPHGAGLILAVALTAACIAIASLFWPFA